MVSWGHPAHGGRSSGLRGVRLIESTGQAFAALLDTGSVSISPLGIIFYFCLYKTQEDIKNIIYITVLRGVEVLAWGDPFHGGDCRAVQEQLVDVQELQGVRSAFLARLWDGFVVAWGDLDKDGDSSVLQALQPPLEKADRRSGVSSSICPKALDPEIR